MRVRRMGTVLLILLTVGLLLSGCGLFRGEETPQRTPEETVQAYLSHLAAGEFAEAYALLSLDAQAQLTPEQFAQLQERARSESQILSFEIETVQSATLVGNVAVVPYSARLRTATGEEVVVYNAARLLREEGTWRIAWPYRP